ncbi:MAG: hypothetical protein BAJATHORv1_30053 [Candidatus Thorarchaeota archaeon]|nr:MAG: hypothetical protein BAJATHORv1_30053 [Candidatus Thorarchaeota archaeon]
MNAESPRKNKLAFNTIVFPNTSSENDAVLLAKSIRKNGGNLSEFQIRMFQPAISKEVSLDAKRHLKELDVDIIQFKIKNEKLTFPFMSEAIAMAEAEKLGLNDSEQIVWLARNSVIIREPVELLLREKEQLRYRPVHHILIGSRYNEDKDAFWNLVYQSCRIDDDQIFPMRTHIDNIEIRPYFNAGCLVTRPESGIFQKYLNNFQREYLRDDFKRFYQKNELYMIFIHQAILSGTIISTVQKDMMVELPSSYNYPVHLHNDDRTENRPRVLDDIVTFRHEGFHQESDWMDKMPASRGLKKWLSDSLVHR